jgi:adenine deaminase
MWLRELM